MRLIRFSPLLVLLITSCSWDWNIDWPYEDCPPAGDWGDAELRAWDTGETTSDETSSDETGSDTGIGTRGMQEGDPICYPENDISFYEGVASCKIGPPSTLLEVMSDNQASLWGITDYLANDPSSSGAALADFYEEPLSWEQDEKSALAGVVTYEQDQETYVAYFGKACCPRELYSGNLQGGYPVHEGCQNAGVGLTFSSSAFCLPLNEDLGLCVYPCNSSEDCPDSDLMQCDLTIPNPNLSGEPGVCRYNSMENVPTPEEEINGMSLSNLLDSN